MKRLLKNGLVVNVFTDELEQANVLIEDGRIAGVGDYSEADADLTEDISGKVVCPGFIDGHIHLESTMLRPSQFARVCLPHGTTAVVADPHEIANVSGVMGIRYLLDASEGLPMNFYFVMPSCVPASPFDETGATLTAEDIAPFFGHERVLGLGEVMSYPDVIERDPEVMEKLEATKKAGLVINGHAPMLSGRELDRYISAGVFDDHECSTAEEAMERLKKGQWIMIRQGTAAHNLEALLPLFREPWSRRCLLVTDDKHPADLIRKGHIDSIIRQAVQMGASVMTGIRMATLQAAQRFGLTDLGAVAPGYRADLIVLDDLQTVRIRDVYYRGEKTVSNGELIDFPNPHARANIWKTVRNSFNLDQLQPKHFTVEPKEGLCRVIRVLPGQLITEEAQLPLDFTKNNGVDTARDIIKLAVVERHYNTGHIGLGYITGLGLQTGAVASSVSHDSHNLIVAGVNEADMAAAANCVREMHGGLAVVRDGTVLAQMPLPIGGLMGLSDAETTAAENDAVRRAVKQLGATEKMEPFMSLAFVSLPVIPALKMTTQGLVDVARWKRVPLFPAEDA